MSTGARKAPATSGTAAARPSSAPREETSLAAGCWRPAAIPASGRFRTPSPAAASRGGRHHHMTSRTTVAARPAGVRPRRRPLGRIGPGREVPRDDCRDRQPLWTLCAAAGSSRWSAVQRCRRRRGTPAGGGGRSATKPATSRRPAPAGRRRARRPPPARGCGRRRRRCSSCSCRAVADRGGSHGRESGQRGSPGDGRGGRDEDRGRGQCQPAGQEVSDAPYGQHGLPPHSPRTRVADLAQGVHASGSPGPAMPAPGRSVSALTSGGR